MEDHVKLFKHFGKEKFFSMDEAMERLGLDPKSERDRTTFAYGPRTMARKWAEEDCQGYFLACPYNDRNRLIFTRDPKKIVAQFKRGRGSIMGQRTVQSVLLRIAQDLGVDDEIEIPDWLHLYELEQRMERKLLLLEGLRKKKAA